MSTRIAAFVALLWATPLGCDVYTPDLLEAAGGAASSSGTTTAAGGADGGSTATTGGAGGNGGSGGAQGGGPPVGGSGGGGGSPPVLAAWINELHYDNAGADSNEGVEIMAAAGVNLNGWSLVVYDGSDGSVSASGATVVLSGIVPNQMNGFGTRWFAVPGLENGAPDGIALVDDGGTLVQLVSYEGTFVATSGPANGTTATAIPLDEEPPPAAGTSLQLTGTGSTYGAFTWVANVAATPDAINPGQVPE